MLEYLTPEEVAEKLRVSQRTVYEWLRNGRLRGLQVGRWWRIRPADLEEFFAVGLLLKALAEMHRAEPDRPAFHYSLIQDHLSLKGHRFEEKALKEALQQAEARGLVSPKPGGIGRALTPEGEEFVLTAAGWQTTEAKSVRRDRGRDKA